MQLISDGDGWMEMIKSRNQTSYTYNDETAAEIAERITSCYVRLFNDFKAKMESLKLEK